MDFAIVAFGALIEIEVGIERCGVASGKAPSISTDRTKTWSFLKVIIERHGGHNVTTQHAAERALRTGV